MLSLEERVDGGARPGFMTISFNIQSDPRALKGKILQLHLASLIHKLNLDSLLCRAMRWHIKTERGEKWKTRNWGRLPFK